MNTLLNVLTREGVLLKVSVSFWRGCKKLKPEDIGLKAGDLSDRLVSGRAVSRRYLRAGTVGQRPEPPSQRSPATGPAGCRRTCATIRRTRETEVPPGGVAKAAINPRRGGVTFLPRLSTITQLLSHPRRSGYRRCRMSGTDHATWKLS